MYNPKKDKLCYAQTYYVSNVSKIKSIWDYISKHKDDIAIHLLSDYIKYDVKTKIDNLRKKEKRSEKFSKIFKKI
jgi:hypothetical protein